MNKFLTLTGLLVITLLGSYLRLADLEIKPNGLYVDEASTGVNAWSILQTGKDEYGKQYPLAFRFLGSYTPPLYTYLTALSINFFGFSIGSIRLVSAVSGILMIPLMFFLIRMLKISKSDLIPLIGSLLFAICPWSIFYSRIGYEINLAFLLYFIGVLFLFISLKSKIFLILAFGVLGLSVNAYHTQRMLSPLTLIVFLTLYKDVVFQAKYRIFLIIAIVLFTIFLLPQLYLLTTPAGLNRAKGVFYSQFLSSPYFLIREFSAQYLSYFSPRNLFFQPDPDLQRSLPELSVFYPWMAMPFLTGLFFLIKENIFHKKFILMLLLLTPIPASLTGDPFATQRALPFLPPVLLVICIVIKKVLDKYKKVGLPAILLLIALSLLYLYRSYATFLPSERAAIWGYGFKQLAEKIKQNPDKKYVIDNARTKPAYIELAFYLKIPPSILQASVDQNIKDSYYTKTNWDGYYRLLNFETRAINWEKDIYQKQILAGDELSISEAQAREHFLTKVFEIKSPIGEIIFRGFETNPEEKFKSL